MECISKTCFLPLFKRNFKRFHSLNRQARRKEKAGVNAERRTWCDQNCRTTALPYLNLSPVQGTDPFRGESCGLGSKGSLSLEPSVYQNEHGMFILFYLFIYYFILLFSAFPFFSSKSKSKGDLIGKTNAPFLSGSGIPSLFKHLVGFLYYPLSPQSPSCTVYILLGVPFLHFA